MARAGMTGAFCDFKNDKAEDSLFRIICFSDSLASYLKTQQLPVVQISVSIEQEGMRITAIGNRPIDSFKNPDGELTYTFVSKKDSR